MLLLIITTQEETNDILIYYIINNYMAALFSLFNDIYNSNTSNNAIHILGIVSVSYNRIE